MDPLNTQPVTPPQEPVIVTTSSTVPPSPMPPQMPQVAPVFTNPVPPPSGKGSKFKLIAIVSLVLVVVCVAAYFIFGNKSSDSEKSTANEKLEVIDETTGLHYKKTKDTDKVQILGEKSYGGAVEGVLVYESTQGTVPSGTIVPTPCASFTQADFGRFDGGIIIVKDLLKNNGASYTTIQDVVSLYNSIEPSGASLVDIAGTKVARVSDGGDGLSESCSGKKFKRALDLTTTYIILTKSGIEVTVALAQSDNTVNGVSVDSVARDKASKFFDEDDLKAQVEYIIANN